MSSNRQLLVALGLAAAVLIIGFRGSSISNKEPTLVAQARLRQLPPVRPAGNGELEHVGAAGDTFDPDARPKGIEEQLSELPLVQVLSLLSGGRSGLARPTDDGESDALTNPEEDWASVAKADSLLHNPAMRRLAERLIAQGAGGN